MPSPGIEPLTLTLKKSVYICEGTFRIVGWLNSSLSYFLKNTYRQSNPIHYQQDQQSYRSCLTYFIAYSAQFFCPIFLWFFSTQFNSIFNIFIHLTSLKSKIVLKRSKKGEQKSNSYYSKRKVAKTPGCWDRLPASSILGTSKEWFPQGTGVLGRRDQVDVYGARGIASWWLPSFKILKKLQQLEFKIFEASHHK